MRPPAPYVQEPAIPQKTDSIGALFASVSCGRGWIYLLVAVVVAATAWTLWRIRTRMLRQRTEQLQAVVSERTEELRRVNESLREANATRERLFSIVAHDLRSPVTGMSALTSRAVREFPRLDRHELEEIVRVLAASARGIQSLLDNLLEWSQLQLGAVALQPRQLAVDDVVPPVIDAFRGAAHHKAIRLVHEAASELEVSADPHSLKTILANLVSNAVKFTPAGGTITVSSMGRETDGGRRTVISVRDSGVGIPEADLAGIFDPGTAGRTVGTAGERGTGLGLSLCRELAELLSGSIRIESEVGVGTTVSIDLPRR